MKNGKQRRAVRLTQGQLRNIVEAVARRTCLSEASTGDIDWEGEAGQELSSTITGLAHQVIEMFVTDDDRVDSFVTEVNNDLLACVEQIASGYDWSADDGSTEYAGRTNSASDDEGPIVSRHR